MKTPFNIVCWQSIQILRVPLDGCEKYERACNELELKLEPELELELRHYCI